MQSCPFCRIPQESPEKVIARNDHCYLLDNPEGSLLKGMMIIPFRHTATPFELSPDEWGEIQPLIAEAHKKLQAFAPDGFNLGWNVGRVGGQEVNHVHLHVFARFEDEPFAGKGIRHWIKSDVNSRPS